MHMLRNTSLGVQEIAAALDYADASALTQAFRRWSTPTPAAWRAKITHAAHGSRRTRGEAAHRMSAGKSRIFRCADIRAPRPAGDASVT
jgi:AraC-like DNA-binding protein